MSKVSIITLPVSRGSNEVRICKMIYENGKVKRTNIGFKINIKDWCKETKRVKPSNKNYTIINTEIDNILNQNEPSITLNKDCIISYMENSLENDYMIKTLKYSTYIKYKTIAKSFRMAITQLNMDTLRLNDILNKDKLGAIVAILSTHSDSNNRKKLSLKNYLVVFASFVKKYHLESNGNLTADFSYIHKIVKKPSPKHANYLTVNELDAFKNYQPIGYRNTLTQTITKSIFLSQYYIGGIRVSDILTITNKQFMDDGIQIKIRKNGEPRLYPYSFELVESLEPLYPNLYQSVIKNIKINNIELPAPIASAVIRSGLDTEKCDLKNITNLINNLKVSIIEEYKNIAKELQDLTRIIKIEITRKFFNKLRDLQECFIFPLLDYNTFKNHLNNLEHLNQELSYSIHRATTKYNSNLKVICRNLNLPKKLTSHSPRHSIALHLMERGATTPIIQDVLGQRNLNSTATYLNQRLPSVNVKEGMALIHR
jgi:integrase